MKKFLTWFIIIIAGVILCFFYFRFYLVIGRGVSAGELNYVVQSGVIFKTYEGKMIQAGFASKTAGALQSNEFKFSVVGDSIARKLMLSGSKTVELHYKQYFGSLPWRGNSRFVVDSIIAIQPGTGPSAFPQ